jgi:hypothetical protein
LFLTEDVYKGLNIILNTPYIDINNETLIIFELNDTFFDNGDGNYTIKKDGDGNAIFKQTPIQKLFEIIVNLGCNFGIISSRNNINNTDINNGLFGINIKINGKDIFNTDNSKTYDNTNTSTIHTELNKIITHYSSKNIDKVIYFDASCETFNNIKNNVNLAFYGIIVGGTTACNLTTDNLTIKVNYPYLDLDATNNHLILKQYDKGTEKIKGDASNIIKIGTKITYDGNSGIFLSSDNQEGKNNTIILYDDKKKQDKYVLVNNNTTDITPRDVINNTKFIGYDDPTKFNNTSIAFSGLLTVLNNYFNAYFNATITAPPADDNDTNLLKKYLDETLNEFQNTSYNLYKSDDKFDKIKTKIATNLDTPYKNSKFDINNTTVLDDDKTNYSISVLEKINTIYYMIKYVDTNNEPDKYILQFTLYVYLLYYMYFSVDKISYVIKYCLTSTDIKYYELKKVIDLFDFSKILENIKYRVVSKLRHPQVS